MSDVGSISENWAEDVRAAGWEGHRTPEAAALSGYSPVMRPRVIRSVPSAEDPDLCIVWVDTEPSHRLRETCVRVDGAWHNVASG